MIFLWVIPMCSMLLIRFFDIFLSIIFIIIFSPLFIIISFLIIILDGFPILFISQRVGINGNLFKMYKFRSMKIKKEKNNKDEITNLGKFLRRSSFDEFPQFINILKNEMSIVGPRPLPLEIENQIIGEFKILRRTIKPGITGYSQILFNKKKRNWDEKISQDIKYIREISFRRYILIIFLTFPAIIKRFRFNNKGRTL